MVKNRNIYIILIVAVCLFFIKIFTHGITIGLGGDELIKWTLANDFVFFQSHYSFTHHEMRWAHWFQSMIFTNINNPFWGYYLASLIPSFLGFFIIAYSILKIAGVIPSIIFLIITTFDQNILESSFTLLPENGLVLPLSIIIFLLLNKNFQLDNVKNILIIFFLSIWMYGIKETNIFFLPGIAYLILIQGGLKYLIQFVLLFIFFYVIETAMLLFHAAGPMSPFGRLHQLLLIGKEYIFTDMMNNDGNVLNLHSQINKWTSFSNSYFYISTFILLVNNFILFKKNSNCSFSLNFSYPIFSFIIFSTFMVYQSFLERYWLILLPIFYANIILLFFIFFKKINIFLRCFVLLIALILFNNSASKNIYNSINSPVSLLKIIEKYNIIKNNILESDCTLINFNIDSSHAIAYYFYVSLMRVNEHLPYQIEKIENNADKNKSTWKLSFSENCLKTYEFDIKFKNQLKYSLLSG